MCVQVNNHTLQLMGKCHSINIDSKIKHTPHTVQSIKRYIARRASHWYSWCKTIYFLYNVMLLSNHWKPRPQVAYCWRNIDYLNVSLWTQSPGAAQCALFRSLFSLRFSRSVLHTAYPPCKLRSPSTSWPNLELTGLFFCFYDKTSPRILQVPVHFSSQSLSYMSSVGWWSWGESWKPTTGERRGFMTLRYRWLNTLSIKSTYERTALSF